MAEPYHCQLAATMVYRRKSLPFNSVASGQIESERTLTTRYSRRLTTKCHRLDELLYLAVNIDYRLSRVIDKSPPGMGAVNDPLGGTADY